MRPFEGVRILDFSRVISGPYATYLLHLLGAEVVKVEQVSGDDLRKGMGLDPLRSEGITASYIMFNSGKKSVTLNLKSPKAIEIIQNLTRTADVVVENFRPGVMDRLGIGYKALRKINPKIIFCSISGFGQEGPESKTPAYDGKIQAMSGMMSVTGPEGGMPLRAGFTVADTTAGINAALAISAALYQRTRLNCGQYIDVSMLDSAMSLMSQSFASYLNGGIELTRTGNRSISREPTSDVFEASDCEIMLSVNKDHQIKALMNEIGRDDLIGDPRFASRDIREKNREFIYTCVQAELRKVPGAEWERRLNDIGVPCSRILTISEVVEHPQVKHNENILEIKDKATGNPMFVIKPGFRFAHGTPGTEQGPDRTGEHNMTLLAELGFTADEIEQLSNEGVM